MINKRPKDCPQKDKMCLIENTRACKILTKLRKDGHECCGKIFEERKFPDNKQEEIDILRGK